MKTGHLPSLSQHAQREINDNWLSLRVHEALEPQAVLLLVSLGIKKMIFSPKQGTQC